MVYPSRSHQQPRNVAALLRSWRPRNACVRAPMRPGSRGLCHQVLASDPSSACKPLRSRRLHDACVMCPSGLDPVRCVVAFYPLTHHLPASRAAACLIYRSFFSFTRLGNFRYIATETEMMTDCDRVLSLNLLCYQIIIDRDSFLPMNLN